MYINIKNIFKSEGSINAQFFNYLTVQDLKG